MRDEADMRELDRELPHVHRWLLQLLALAFVGWLLVMLGCWFYGLMHMASWVYSRFF